MRLPLPPFSKKKQYTLSYRLVVYVVLCSSLFAIIATAIQLYLDYRRDVSALHDSFRLIEKSYLPTIARSTYKIDQDHLRLELEGALKLPDIVYLEVQEVRGSQILTHAHGNPNAEKIIRNEFPLVYISPTGEKRPIGTLIVMASLEGVYQRLWSRVVTILVTNVGKTFLASAGILAIIYLLITRHLLRMADFTKHLTPGTKNRLLTLDRNPRDADKPDELEHVVLAINELQERVAADIIKQRQAELKYRTVADFTYDWEYWQSPDGNFSYISPSCERITGYRAEEFMNNPRLLEQIILPENRNIWLNHQQEALEEPKQRDIQFRIRRKDGEIRWIEHACQGVIDDRGEFLGLRVSNRDITKREFYKSETIKLQTELAHMDRIVTISTLTTALAHEINQPLAAMRSYAQAAMRFMEAPQPEYDSVRKALKGIIADNKRAAEVVNRLRDLVKKGPALRKPLEINSIINDVIGLLNSEIVLRKASVALDLHPIAPVVHDDSIQIQQVLINLLTNALDAVDDESVKTRTITISTKSENSNHTMVSISDSGSGIPTDRIQAIFEPFHTTKSKGIGLGLAICKSIIEAHGGTIWVDNNPGGGAIFSFTLPTSSQIK